MTVFIDNKIFAFRISVTSITFEDCGMDGESSDYNLCAEYQANWLQLKEQLRISGNKYFSCVPDAIGKYVIIQLINIQGYISFTEIEVFGILFDG